MKIRHKQSGVELEGVRDSGPDFVEGASVIQPSSIYSKEHWEAVPEWVNVTEANGYVVSRVRIDEIHDETIGARYAFIVYRKKNQ